MRSSASVLGLSLATKVRIAFALVSVLFAAVSGEFALALPWILLVVALDLGATALDAIPGLKPSVMRSQRLVLIGIGAACSGAAFTLGGAATAPLALIPAYHGGLRAGRRGFATAYLVAAAAAVGCYLFLPEETNVSLPPLAAWLVSIALLGTLGTWSHRLSGDDEEPDPAATEALALIGRLHELSDDIGTGLDAPAHAASVLDDLVTCAKSDRSFMLVGTEPQHLVPVALRGATRVPWATGGSGSGLLETAWGVERPAAFLSSDDSGPRAVLALPMTSTTGERSGILIADRGGHQPFDDEEVATASAVFSDAQPMLNAALLFGSLRARAGLEERRRLAREIHDGIAQELAALGYAIDALRMVAQATSNPMAADFDSLRESLRGTLADVRGHIADLKMPQRPETGLGAVIGAAVQNFGSVTGIRTTMSAREEGVRLPSHIELLVYRLAMDSLADAQAGAADSITVELEVHAPHVRLVVSHDGECALGVRDLMNEKWHAIGGAVEVDPTLGKVRIVATRTETHTPPASPAPAGDDADLWSAMTPSDPTGSPTAAPSNSSKDAR